MKKTRIILGLYFVAAGIFLILNELNLWNISFIKAVISILLLPLLVNGIKNCGFARILFPTVIIYTMFSKELSLPDISIWIALVSALILSVGLNLIFPKKKIRSKYQKNDNPTEDDPDNPVILGKFTGITKYLCSDNLKTMGLYCSFSGIKLFCDKVVLNPDGATVNCDICFSGVDIFIPRSWKVIDKTHSIGGIILPCEETVLPDDAPKLILQGQIRFSGINIRYI